MGESGPEENAKVQWGDSVKARALHRHCLTKETSWGRHKLCRKCERLPVNECVDAEVREEDANAENPAQGSQA